MTCRKLALFSTEILGVPLTAFGAMGPANRVCDRLVPADARVGTERLTPSASGADATGWRTGRRHGYIGCCRSDRLADVVADHSRAARARQHLDDLVRFARNPAVQPHNNRTDHQVRPSHERSDTTHKQFS